MIGNLSGRARPASHLRAPLALLAGEAKTVPLEQAMDDAVAVESLAALLGLAQREAPGDLNLQAAIVIDAMRKAT
jgi:hypothetical protein